MKKVLVALVTLFLFVGMTYAQDATLRAGRNQVATLSTTNGKLTAADTISSNGVNYWVFEVDAGNPFFYELAVSADSVTTPTATFLLQESINNVVYSNVDTVSWAGSSSDTTFSFTQKSTSRKTKFVRLYGSDTGKSLIDRLDFGIWIEQ